MPPDVVVGGGDELVGATDVETGVEVDGSDARCLVPPLQPLATALEQSARAV